MTLHSRVSGIVPLSPPAALTSSLNSVAAASASVGSGGSGASCSYPSSPSFAPSSCTGGTHAGGSYNAALIADAGVTTGRK